MSCAIEFHPLRAKIDAFMLNDRAMPARIHRWLQEQNAPPVSVYILQRHRLDCLKIPPLRSKDRAVRDGPQTLPPEQPEGKRPSDELGHDVTDADIDQRLMKRIYDAIDLINPDRVADLMLEREKNRGKALAAPAKKPTSGDDEVPADVQELRRAAAAALGPKTSRTSARRAS